MTCVKIDTVSHVDYCFETYSERQRSDREGRAQFVVKVYKIITPEKKQDSLRSIIREKNVKLAYTRRMKVSSYMMFLCAYTFTHRRKRRAVIYLHFDVNS